MQKQTQESINNFKQELKTSNILSKLDLSPDADPNSNFNIFNNCIAEIKDTHFKNKTVNYNKYKHKKSAWITQGILKSIKFRNKFYKALRMSEPESNELSSIKSNLRSYNKILRSLIKDAKQSYYRSCFQNFKHNIKKTWSTISSIINTKKHTDIPDFFTWNNKTFKDKTEIANQFNLFFTNIGPELASKIKIHPDKSYKKYLVRKTLPDFNFNIISDIDIIKVIDHLENKTSCGVDGISNSLLKTIKSEIVQPVTVLINQMLTTGIFPDKLKIAKVVPLYKKGDNTLFSNYRPISILPSLSKIFEKIVYSQLYAYFEGNKLLYSSQYGFRQGHSTEFAALELIKLHF